LNRSKLIIVILAVICGVLVIANLLNRSPDTLPTDQPPGGDSSKAISPYQPSSEQPAEESEQAETTDTSKPEKPVPDAPGSPKTPSADKQEKPEQDAPDSPVTPSADKPEKPDPSKTEEKPDPSKTEKKTESIEKTESAEDLGDPNDPIVAINLKDTPMADIIQKIGEWTGKVIIPNDDALKQKITIYSTQKMPRSKALAMIYTALHNKGFIVEQTDDVIYLKPIKDAKLTSVPTVSAEEPLAAIENKDLIVQKFFHLNIYIMIKKKPPLQI